jgi:hypothetical protein
MYQGFTINPTAILDALPAICYAFSLHRSADAGPSEGETEVLDAPRCVTLSCLTCLLNISLLPHCMPHFRTAGADSSVKVVAQSSSGALADAKDAVSSAISEAFSSVCQGNATAAAQALAVAVANASATAWVSAWLCKTPWGACLGADFC